jgi:hypothetical protein
MRSEERDRLLKLIGQHRLRAEMNKDTRYNEACQEVEEHEEK